MKQKIPSAPYTKDSECDQAAERVVLATIFREQMVDRIKSLAEADFTDHLHSLIIKAFKEMVKREAPIEFAPLYAILKTPEYIEAGEKCGVNRESSLGGAVELVLDEFSNPANLEYYFRVLRKDRLRRSLLRLGAETQRKARERPLDPLETLQWVKRNATGLIKRSGLVVEE